jgi:hypothetical protein
LLSYRVSQASIASIPAAMSSFLPVKGANVIPLSTEDLRRAFDDVQDDETAVIVSLKEDEVRSSPSMPS